MRGHTGQASDRVLAAVSNAASANLAQSHLRFCGEQQGDDQTEFLVMISVGGEWLSVSGYSVCLHKELWKQVMDKCSLSFKARCSHSVPAATL